MSEQSPTISVLITVYNGMPYLRDAIEALLNQTYRNFEIVVVDDGSSDDTLLYLNGLSDERVKVVRGGRLGRGRALNLGLVHCSGEYIAINDADDISYPTRLKKQFDFLQSNASHVLVGSLSHFRNRQTDEIVIHRMRPLSDETIKRALTKGQPIQHVTVMMRKDALTAVNGYNENIKFLFDRDLFIRLAKIGKLANLPDSLVEVGHHPNRFFYFNYTGYQRELLSLKYRIRAIRLFGFSRWWILRELARSLWSLLPWKFRRFILRFVKWLIRV